MSPPAPSAKPLFVDNRNGNTLAVAITEWLRALRREERPASELCIASAYFNPQGLALIFDEARHASRVRILLGAEPTPEREVPLRKPGEPPEPEWTRRRVHAALVQQERGLRRDRNLIPFEPEQDRELSDLLAFLRADRVEVRRYEGHFLHAKAFIVRGEERGLVAGSSNLTRAGMLTNLELNLGHHDDPLVGQVEAWFEALWQEAVPFDLAAIYEEVFAPHDPYLIFLKVLWHLYAKELFEEAAEPGHIPITNFQRHGVWRARRILEQFGGVLVADGVGLGKTYTAGEIMRAYRERRQRVLLICPAALRDTTWEKFLNDFFLGDVECVSYEELARDVQLAPDGGVRHLNNPLQDYALVVIDEAHNYRNPDAPTRAAVLRRLLAGRRRDVVMLSATPVNNSLWDLYHLLRFFLKQDAALADRGVLSVRERFELAMRQDPFDLSPDLLYPIIDATTVKRTRRFVKKHYENDLVRGPDGTLVPIRFPRPIASSILYDLEDVLPGFFDRLEDVLMPANAHPELTMARYKPERYLAGIHDGREDNAITGLLRSALLKRFESSTYAFARTLRKMILEHEAFLAALDRGKVVRKEFFRELSAGDAEWDIEELIEASEHADDAAGYDARALRKDVQADLRLLRSLVAEAEKAHGPRDPKIQALVEELVRIAETAKSEAADGEDECQKRKVLVFSHYEDTIDWIEEQLGRVLARDARLSVYRRRHSSVSGADSRNGVGREEAIYGFAPITSGALPPHDEDRFDLLLCTDVLAEGMNLQQCRHIINYDLPWNPMRLVQRHGRIDRIGSRHRDVFLRTFFPDRQLDALLNLEARVRRKLAQAAASVGVEDAPIERGATGEQSFADTRDEIERLRKEDASIYEAGGTEGAAQTGEEYRQELRRALQRYGKRIEELPWRVGSGMAKGDVSGHFFCAAVGERIYLRFVPLVSGGAVVREIGTCLRLIDCDEDTPAVLSDAMREAAYAAWMRAREDVYEAWTYETDPKNLQPRVRKLNRDVAEFLRQHPPPKTEQAALQKTLDAVEAPWSRREEQQLREVWELDFESSAAKSDALASRIAEIGAEPFQAPDPLPPIDPEDVHLICWLAIEAVDGASERRTEGSPA